MSELLEITDKDIAELNDTDLRSLIGLLCEAECRKNGISTKAIQWGGPQDAPDDGIDVLVTSDIQFPMGSYIPRSNVIFQSKVTDMTAVLIRREMKPSGQLRESIRELAKTEGAYIIVSGHSLESKRYNQRIAEMRKIIGELGIVADYYHGGRIASWVRENPSTVLWVRQRSKRPIFGWKSYYDWTLNLGIGETYILDRDCRLIDKRERNGSAMTVGRGISSMRKLLSQSGSYLRLTGLSGVGKTRLAQALFDDSIGSGFLNKSTVIYTDISYEPTPSPQNLVEQLLARQDKALLIIDNCTPKLHADMVSKLKIQPHCISLLTIEYDVRDDLPDETGVFHLEPSSDQLIQKLILRRFPKIGELDAWKIADASGGNARVAIALANTVRAGESIGQLKNKELFNRLFNQRNVEDDSLKWSAEILSMVYSFDTEDIGSGFSELEVLSLMSGIPAKTLYKHTAKLRDRDLVQARGKYRAVLPHAIANELATAALEGITNSSINDNLLQEGNERLILSFTRRLSYIPDNEQAQDIVKNWLAPEIGWMTDVSSLNEFGMSVFENLATIVPEHALAAIERATLLSDKFASRENRSFSQFVRLLWHIAYDEHLFVRSAKVIADFALTEKLGENFCSVRRELEDLFHIDMSGTHASAKVRLKVISELWESNNALKQQLATELIDAAFEAWHFQPRRNPTFGSRSRDFGVSLQNPEEIENWFKEVVAQYTLMFNDNTLFKAKLKKNLSKKLRGIWTKARLFDLVESVCKEMTSEGFWGEGWLEILWIVRFDLKDEGIEFRQRTLNLEKTLRPKDLFEQLVAFFMSGARGIDIADVLLDENECGLEKLFKRYEGLGAKLAKDEETLEKLASRLLVTPNRDITHIGRGLYSAVARKKTAWNNLVLKYLALPSHERQSFMLKGWIIGAHAEGEKYSDQILEEILNAPELNHLLVPLQSAIPISLNGVKYLQQALENLEIHSREFEFLSYSIIDSNISPYDLTDIIKRILNRPNGSEAAFEILYYKCHVVKAGSANDITSELLAIGQQLLLGLDLSKELHWDGNYKISVVVQICFEGTPAFNLANEFTSKLMRLVRSEYGFQKRANGILKKIVKVQPICFLNSLLEKGIQNERLGWVGFYRNFEKYDTYLSTLSDDLLLSWCEADPSERYKLLGGAMINYEGVGEGSKLTWKPFFWKLVIGAPNLLALLDEVEETLKPSTAYVSRVEVYQDRLTLFSVLFDNPNEELSKWARFKFRQWTEEIATAMNSKEKYYQERNESFE